MKEKKDTAEKLKRVEIEGHSLQSNLSEKTEEIEIFKKRLELHMKECNDRQEQYIQIEEKVFGQKSNDIHLFPKTN